MLRSSSLALVVGFGLLLAGGVFPDVPKDEGGSPRWPRTGDLVGKDGAPMVLVPAGEFLAGSDKADPLAHASETPRLSQFVRAFSIDVFEVTVGQYMQFLSDVERRGHVSCDPSEPKKWNHLPSSADRTSWQSPTRPITNVSWYDAAAFCAWAGERLPTSEEWEKAARGTDGRRYPWGNDPPDARPLGNFADEGHFLTGRASGRGTTSLRPDRYVAGLDDAYRDQAPVGSFPAGASPYGCDDMAGNVREWVGTRFDDHFQRVEQGGVGPEERKHLWGLVRSGSFSSLPRDLRAAAAHRAPLHQRGEDLGFRCAMDPKPADR